MNFDLLRSSLALLALLAVAACGGGSDNNGNASGGGAGSSGGGGGGGGTPQVMTPLSGTAATGAPVSSGQVSVTCGSASAVTATTAANGTWQVDVPDATFPCIVAVTGGSLPAGVHLYGYALAATNVNVTPLTTLVGAYATRAANGAPLTQALLDAAVTEVNGLLATAGLPPLPADPLTVAFTPVAGDTYDDYLESVMTTLAAQDIALPDLVAQITTSNTPPAPIKAVTIDFSDNQASASAVKDGTVDVLQLETLQIAVLPTQTSHHTGSRGNRANFGTEVFHGMKLSAFPGVSFQYKNVGAASSAATPYLNYTVSKQCDGDPNGWINLVTISTSMSVSVPDADGYATYSVSITANHWKATDNNHNRAPDGTTVLLPPLSPSTTPPTSLQAFIAAYPNACIYNWPNPDAVPANATKTPAVMLTIGGSSNRTAAKGWFKDIKVGGVVLF